MDAPVDEGLKAFASPAQRRHIDAINLHGTQEKAAMAIGIRPESIAQSIQAVKRRAAIKGYSPQHDMTHVVPDAFMVKGVSTFYDADGKPSRQWVKTEADKGRMQEIMHATFIAMADELPREKPTAPPKIWYEKLANLYTLTDTHIGALCWDKENLDPLGNWDVKIAEQTLTGCFRRMVESTPNASVGIVAQLGDFLHQDGINAVTPLHGHLLDGDGRYPKIVEAAVRILRRVIGMALEKHEKVIILIAEGNHDLSTSIWLRTMFKALYENEPRIEVIDSVMPYYVYQHGKTMLGWHHGHLSKNDQLPILFASQFSKLWGDTSHRYIHTGHRHHLEIKERSGVTVTQHSTLTARDAYASRGGWMSERQATAYTYHLDHGLVSSVTVTPEMVE